MLEDIRSGTADLGATYVDDLPDFVEAKPVGRTLIEVLFIRNEAVVVASARPALLAARFNQFSNNRSSARRAPKLCRGFG